MALIIGSVFYNLADDTNSLYSRGALLFFSILMAAFQSALEILTLYAQRPIVEKHTKYAFYHPVAEACASMLCDIPNKVFSTIFFDLALYFMTNLRREPGYFFVFFLFTFLCTLTMSMYFRSIASLSRSLSEVRIISHACYAVRGTNKNRQWHQLPSSSLPSSLILDLRSQLEICIHGSGGSIISTRSVMDSRL